MFDTLAESIPDRLLGIWIEDDWHSVVDACGHGIWQMPSNWCKPQNNVGRVNRVREQNLVQPELARSVLLP
jgi:hypothetical protein